MLQWVRFTLQRSSIDCSSIDQQSSTCTAAARAYVSQLICGRACSVAAANFAWLDAVWIWRDVNPTCIRSRRPIQPSRWPSPVAIVIALLTSHTCLAGSIRISFADYDEGGGHWQPDAVALSKLRQDIDRKPHKIKAVLTDERIRKEFLSGVPDHEKKAVKAFTNLATNQSTALKRHPKASTFVFS